RHASPIPGKCLEHDLDAGFAAGEFVWTGADRLVLEAVVSDLSHVFLRQNDAGGCRRGAVKGHEVGPWRIEMKAHDERVDYLDCTDMLLQGRRTRALIAFKAEFYVLGRHPIAVVKRQTGAQPELVNQPVFALLPGLGQAWTHLLAGISAN